MLGVFTTGLLIGGMLSATVLWLFSGLLQPVPPGWRHGVIVVFALACLARDAGAARFWMPQNARQIPQEVLQRHLVRGTLQFGFELGTGVRTYVSSSAAYALAVAVLLSGAGIGTALAVGCGFGLGRAATPVARRLSGDPAGWDRRLGARLRLLTCACCGAVAVLLAVTGSRVVG
ncbi:hypothetical protein [Streptomyces sp. SM14]|uniref:hypothetical protein n=2 Tax=unclassified Streptomyces TaxID=2593676 RepID=UPI00215638DA|nr:hypothetical protein [Streptomyces sp. SM14]